jgi:hypothetical protein
VPTRPSREGWRQRRALGSVVGIGMGSELMEIGRRGNELSILNTNIDTDYI